MSSYFSTLCSILLVFSHRSETRKCAASIAQGVQAKRGGSILHPDINCNDLGKHETVESGRAGFAIHRGGL